MGRFVKIRCNCGDLIKVIKPIHATNEKGLKSHGHCRKCQLEWHLTWDGKIYSHHKKMRRTPLTLTEQAARRVWRQKMYANMRRAIAG